MQWKEERIQNGTGLAVFEGGTDGGAGLTNLEVRFGRHALTVAPPIMAIGVHHAFLHDLNSKIVEGILEAASFSG